MLNFFPEMNYYWSRKNYHKFWLLFFFGFKSRICLLSIWDIEPFSFKVFGFKIFERGATSIGSVIFNKHLSRQSYVFSRFTRLDICWHFKSKLEMLDVFYFQFVMEGEGKRKEGRGYGRKDRFLAALCLQN